MILFKEICSSTQKDVLWLQQNLGRSLEDACLRSVDANPDGSNSASSLIESLQITVGEILNNLVQHASPTPSFISLEVRLVGSAIRIEVADDGGAFQHFRERYGPAQTASASNINCERGLSGVDKNLQNVEYHAGKPNRFVGWRKLRRERPNILVVDDHPGNADGIHVILQENYEVICAKTFVEVQSAIEDRNIDVIIFDYGMSIKDQDTFKVNCHGDPIPVIILASLEDCEHMAKRPVAHVDQFLQKPVSASKLICALEIALASCTRRLIHLANSFGKSAGVLLTDQLPREFPGFKLEVLSGIATYGGGDFALALSGDGFTRLVLADIMGHGLQAKAAAITLSSIVRTLHCQSAVASNVLLASISDIIGREPSFSNIMTTLIIVDAATDGWIDAASAGHPPIAIISAERSFVLSVSGPLPGLMMAPNYQLARYHLQRGDKIVFVSDGIDGQAAATGSFPDRLLLKLGMNPSLPLDALKEEMKQWLMERLGPAPKDDWTLMIGEYCGAEHHASEGKPPCFTRNRAQRDDPSILRIREQDADW